MHLLSHLSPCSLHPPLQAILALDDPHHVASLVTDLLEAEGRPAEDGAVQESGPFGDYSEELLWAVGETGIWIGGTPHRGETAGPRTQLSVASVGSERL